MPIQTSTMPFAYFHKQIIPFEEAKISIACNSLQYGLTCFSGIRGYVRQDGKSFILRLEDHFIRLMNGVKILGMQYDVSWEEFKSIIMRLVKANAPQSDFYIRPFVFSESPNLGPRFTDVEFQLGIYCLLIKRYYATETGLRLKISTWHKFADDMIPTKAKAGGGYVNSALATTEAVKAGYDDALMTDDHGNIVETSVANIFLANHGEIIAPELGSPILEGITRRTVIELLKEEGIPVRFEKIDRSTVYTCDELIITGTAAQIIFAQSVDDRIISKSNQPGPICGTLRKRYSDILEGKHPKSKDWLTEVS